MTSIDRRTVLFVTKVNCSLCDTGLDLVRRYARRFGVRVDVVDIASSTALAEEFAERVPVILGFGHRVLAEGRLTPWAVQRALVKVRFR
jgi:hypothetical protein